MRRLTILLNLSVVGSALALLAQSGSGTISGTVFDNLEAPLPAADIQVKNTATGEIRQTKSAAKGEYTLGGLPAGAYELAVDVRGGRRFAEKATVEAGKIVKMDVHIKDDGQLGTLGDNFLAHAALDRRPVPTGPTPKALDGHTDFSGVWTPTRPISSDTPEPLPSHDAAVKAIIADGGIGNPTARCLPWGPVLDGSWPIKFIQSPSTIVILIEDVFSYRQIHMDGRGHPEDADPTWMGHSIGHWEGDALVVDTRNFNDKSWSPSRRPHTDKLHLIERFRRPDLGHLEIETTIDDPGSYKKPWTMKRAANLFVGEEIGEYICVENNQDVEHLVAK